MHLAHVVFERLELVEGEWTARTEEVADVAVILHVKLQLQVMNERTV